MDASPFASLRDFKQKNPEPGTPMSSMGAKIMQLNEKLNSLQGTPSEAPVRRDNYEARINQLEEQIDKQTLAEEQQFEKLHEDLLKVSAELGSQKAIIEEIEITGLRQAKLIENEFAKEQIQFKADCKDSNLRILQAFQESSLNLKHQWKTEVKALDESQANSKRQVQSQVTVLQDAITLEMKVREQKNEALIGSVTSALNGLTYALNLERKKREENHLLMLRNLEQLNSRLQADIRQEEVIRRKSDELLFRLLDQTCSRVQACIRKKHY